MIASALCYFVLAVPGAWPDSGAAFSAPYHDMTSKLRQAAAMYLYMTPIDDVWVYPHAGDPQKDEFLRAWGVGGRAIAAQGDDEQSFAYSFLRWDVSAFPKNAKVVSAELVLTHAPDPAYTVEQASAAPLEVRAMRGNFSESEWSYDKLGKVAPEEAPTGVFATTAPTDLPQGTAFALTFNLMSGPNDFAQYFRRALRSQRPFLLLAITSPIDPSQVGREGVYKVYSKDTGLKEFRPVLKVLLSKD